MKTPLFFVKKLTLKPCQIDPARRAVNFGTTIIQNGWQEVELRQFCGFPPAGADDNTGKTQRIKSAPFPPPPSHPLLNTTVLNAEKSTSKGLSLKL